MSSAELVGRDVELAAVAAAVRQLSAGRASVLVIEGEAGIGKTRLVQCVADDARSRGLAVFYGQAHPFERTRPFGVVASAFGLSQRTPDPRRAQIDALLGGEGSEPPAASGDITYRVVEEIVDLADRECLERPALLVFEDVHWADSASLLTILSLARQLPLAPLLVVLTTRPSPLSGEVVRLLDDLTVAGATTLRLEPLTSDDVAVLAGQLLGASAGPALTAMLDKAGGNPLWVVAMVRALREQGMLRRSGRNVEVTTSELPASLSELVVRRLRQLPTSTLELLRVSAVLGDSVTLRDVAAVARRAPADVVTQLSHAFDARLLDESGGRMVFRHQLVHDAIYQNMPQSARRLLHREAAATLMVAGADPLDVADHLMLGAERGDEQAIAWLREAAREAATRSPVVAVELVRRAEALLPGGHRDADLLSSEVVQALLRAGKIAEACERAEVVLARRHAPEVDTPLRLALLGALALQNRATELIAAAEAALSASPVLRPSEQVPMLAQQSWALTYSGDPRGGESIAGRALLISEQAGDPAMTVWALTALMVAVGRQGRFGEALAHSRRGAALADRWPDTGALPLQPKFFLGLALFDCDLVEEARVAYRQALEGEFGAGWWLSDTLMADAEVSFVLGEWDDALPGLVAGGQAAQEKGNQLLVSQALAYRAIIATATGDHPTARDLTGRLATELSGDQLSYNAAVLASAVAGLRAAQGDLQGSYDVLLRCWRYDVGRENRFYYRFLAPGLVHAALALGKRDVATEVARAVAAAVALAPEVASLRSVALRCQGLVDRDAEPVLEAVALARRVPLLLGHTGACEDAAGLLTREGQRKEAVALLSEALERYEHAGADAWSGKVRAQLRALGVRPGSRGARHRPTAGWESLTATEQKVSLLVAEGLTNGAVARQLYMSPHTVNSHLRHVFAKLDVPNRVALAAAVHARSSDVSGPRGRPHLTVGSHPG